MLRRLAPVAGALVALIVLPAAASAVVPNPNPWLTKRFLNIAHQGGEDEAPSNTLFAFKSAMNARGADSIELDVNLSLDGDLMVIHDDTVNRITQETGLRVDGQSEVNDLTTAEVQALDGSYSFRPGAYDDSNAGGLPYPVPRHCDGRRPSAARGMQPPTSGSRPSREVLDAFPTTPINIEIKMIKTEAAAARIPKPGGCVTQGTPPDQHEYCDDDAGSIPVAEALADVLNEPQYASRTDIIVVSFAQELVQAFHDLAPQVALAPGVAGVVNYAVFGMTPVPDVAAFQVPPGPGRDPRARDAAAEPGRASGRLRGPRLDQRRPGRDGRQLQAPGRPRRRRDHDHVSRAS